MAKNTMRQKKDDNALDERVCKRYKSSKNNGVNEEVGTEDTSVQRYSVCELNAYLKEPWVFVGRVVCKNHVKYWKNLSSSGKLFDLFVLDGNGDGIRMVVFNDGVDCFESKIQTGRVYEFSHGRVKHMDERFSSEDSRFELSFNSNSRIRVIDEKLTFCDKTQYVFG